MTKSRENQRVTLQYMRCSANALLAKQQSVCAHTTQENDPETCHKKVLSVNFIEVCKVTSYQIYSGMKMLGMVQSEMGEL